MVVSPNCHYCSSLETLPLHVSFFLNPFHCVFCHSSTTTTTLLLKSSFLKLILQQPQPFWRNYHHWQGIVGFVGVEDKVLDLSGRGRWNWVLHFWAWGRQGFVMLLWGGSTQNGNEVVIEWKWKKFQLVKGMGMILWWGGATHVHVKGNEIVFPFNRK